MPKLRVFDLSENYIEKVFNFNNKYIPNLKELRLISNNIAEFP
jgi:Leucine-rich repeat (LRR) protein